MARLVWILIVCGALFSCVSTPPPAAATEQEVQQASERFWSSRGDASSLAAQLTEDAILMVPGLPDATGRTAVQELMPQRFAASRSTDFKVHRREITMAGDAAYELAWYSETHHGQGESLRLQGRYVIVWKHGDGVWRMHRTLFNFADVRPDA